MGLAFKERVGLTLLGRGATIGIGLLSSIVTARYLGPDGRGVLAALSVITGLALQFGNPGLHTGNVYFVARDPRRAAAVLGNTFVVSVGAGLLFGAAAVLCAWARPGWFPGLPFGLIVLTSAVLPFQFMILLYQNTLLGLGEVKAFNVFEVGNKAAIFALLAIYLAAFGGGPAGAVVLFAVMGVLFGASSALYCARRVPFRPVLDRDLFVEMIRYGARVYASCLLSFLVIRSDVLLVNYFRGVGETGVYSIAVQVADTLLLLPVTVGMILLPRVAAELRDRQEGITARVLRHTALLMTLLCGAAFVLVDPVVRLLYGPGFEGAIRATRCLLPGVWALGLNGVLMNHFGGQGMPAVTIVGPFMGLILNLSLNLAVVPRFGIVGAAVASSAAYALMLAASLLAFVRRGRVRLRDSLLLRADDVRLLLGHQGP
jgi:O-antigen/teichoic acid export membrane protein